jgi:hypothetical protein
MEQLYASSYVKEVQTAVNTGLTAKQAHGIYHDILDEFINMFDRPETEDFRREIADLRKHERGFYRTIIDLYVVEHGLDWRTVKFDERRVKRCEHCMNYYYDFSRNGLGKTCYRRGVYKRFNLTTREFYYRENHGIKMSECGVALENSKHPTVRRVQEMPFDPNPSEGDKKGHAILQSVNGAYQRHLHRDSDWWAKM